jgi:steroid delta-isomerase
MTADAASIRATVDAYCAAFTAGDQAAYVGLFTPDAWIEDPVGTPRHEGHEAIGTFFELSSAMAESIELRQTGPVRVAAGECAFPMQARPVIGGATLVVDIIDVMTFDDEGKITTMRAFWDPAEMRPADDA